MPDGKGERKRKKKELLARNDEKPKGGWALS